MKKISNIDLSVIIPVYNVEEYLPACIDSLMHQGDLRLEVILVNDGATDRSRAIANQYASQDNRVKVIPQENGGTSAARNVGLEISQGEYIAFIDSYDWVKQGSLAELFREAIRHQADVVMGNMLFYYQDGSLGNPYQPAPKDIRDAPLLGKEGFVRLAKAGAYPPMACNYIYRRSYLKKIQARFEEGIMHEDELWCPIVLYKAEKFVVVDIDFYYYRQKAGSVMHTTKRQQHLKALFTVTDRLMEFAEHLGFFGDDGAFKNWLYVTIFRLYATAFTFLSRIKDTSYVVPKHHLDHFWRDCWAMMPEPQKICRYNYNLAVTELKRYTDWCTSEWVASIAFQINTGRRLMLIYNVIRGENLSLKEEAVPADWLITIDRRYFKQADVVVFYLPDLAQELEDDLDKPEGQIWVAWHLAETEKNYPWVNDPEIKNVFDLQVYYPEDEIQKEHPLIQLCRTINHTLFKYYES